MRRCRRAVAVALALTALAACGKKGPPLAPLHLVPARIEDVKAVRRGSEIELRFTLPKANTNGPGPVDLGAVDVYAVTVAPGAPTPPNRDLMVTAHKVGTVPVKPPLEEGGPTVDPQEGDTRPSAGEPAMFVEPLSEEKLTPLPVKIAPAAPTKTTAEPLPFLRTQGAEHTTRVYVLRGATRSGRPGVPSAQVAVPLTTGPPPAAGLEADYTEQAITIAWEPPPLPEEKRPDEVSAWLFLAPHFPYLFYRAPPPATSFNVYRAGESLPLNPAPLTEAEFTRPGVEFGVEQCFTVRTVRTSGAVAIESEASAPLCVTPVDTFPPAAPKGLQAVAGAGDINLSWDTNTEADLAGYIVLRGEGPDPVLQPLTTAPIAETRYRDANVQPGVRYVYAVVAVDKTRPPNLSPQSARVDETAR